MAIQTERIQVEE